MSRVVFPPEVIRVKTWLLTHEFKPDIKFLSVSARTSADAASALGCELGRIAKSLVFYDVLGNAPILIIASGVNRVDKGKVGEYLHKKIKTAGPDFVLEKTGYLAGGVPPVAHKTLIRTLIDKDLMRYDQVWAAAGHPYSLFPISPRQLTDLTKAEIVDIY